jgi:hypothetical protein
VVLLAEPWKRDRVFDEDGVVLGAGDQRPVRVLERELVDLDGAPGVGSMNQFGAEFRDKI